jgi:hypothetical protein
MRLPIVVTALALVFATRVPASAELLFEAEHYFDRVNVYRVSDLGKNAPPIYEITDAVSEPFGVAIAPDGSLYVANPGNNTISIYKAGSRTHTDLLTDGVDGPHSVQIDASGTVYVANAGNGTIAIYPPGAHSPSATFGHYECLGGSALDVRQNFYFTDFCVQQVYEVERGTTTATSLGLTGLSSPEGVGFDAHGNLWVTYIGPSYGGITVFKPGQTSPFTFIGGFEAPDYVATDRRHRMFVSDFGIHPNVTEFEPGSFAALLHFNNGLLTPIGLATRE